MKLLVCIAVLLSLSGCGGGGGSSHSNGGDGTALVSWTPPDQNEDGTALTDLAGYRIHYGNAPGDYEYSIILDNVGMSSYLIENLGKADWYFAMTAFNSLGIESAYSDEVHKTIE